MVGIIKKVWLILATLLPAGWTLSTHVIRAEAAICMPGSYENLVNSSTVKNTVIYQFKCTPIFGKNFFQSAQHYKNQVSEITSYIHNFAYALAGISMGIATLVIVYAGFLYVTSSGDPRRIQLAKNYILGAGIGMLFSFLSFVIIQIIQIIFPGMA